MRPNYIFSILILLSRGLDLYTTKIALRNFRMQEQNLLVKAFNLDFETFLVFEFVLALILVLLYNYAYSKRECFDIRADSFKKYINLFFFNKEKSNVKDWLMRITIKKTVLIFGSVIAPFIIGTSILYSMNNFWVYLNKISIESKNYYMKFDNFYFFDVLIFIVPPTFLIVLLYKKIKAEYFKHNELQLKLG